MQYIIGIDIGTTHTKAVVASANGQIITEVKKTYKAAPSSSHHEQDPEDIFTTVMDALKQAIASIADKDQIACISFSAAMHSIMALDKNGKPLTSLYTWADTRSNQQAKRLKESEEGKQIYQTTGTPIHAMSPLCKIAWIRENLPDVFGKAIKFISGKEYVFYRLFNAFVIDHSLATATGLFDFRKLEWFKPAMSFAGIDENHLSQPVKITHAMRGLKESFRVELGLLSDVPFIVGSSDGVLANIGSGAILPGETALTIGTSGAVRSLIARPFIDPHQRLFNYAVDKDHYLCGGATNNGGIILKWFIEVFTDGGRPFEEAIGQLLHEAAFVPAGSEGLIFLPYLYGERAPVWDADAKGIFFGIRAIHTKAHFLRAVLEGIGFSLLQILKALEDSGEQIHTVYASGGFIESALWREIITDVLNKKLSVSHAADASALGAIFMGMQFLGVIDKLEEVKSFIRIDEEMHPNPAHQDIYQKNYKTFAGLYSKLKADF